MEKNNKIRHYTFMAIGFILILTYSCKKNAEIPELITTAVDNIKQTSATSGGNITSDGGARITVHGVCWGKNQMPTITNSKTADSTSVESFSSVIIGLSPNTRYYVRAYATNSAGTGYGNPLSFTTENSGTVTDIDGNVYYTVTIGTQEWMIENLKVTHYRNGESVPNVTEDTAWSNLTTGALCDYNNLPDNSTTYGKLYNWYTLNDSRNLAPVGWHIPTDIEWTELTDYLSSHGYGYLGNSNDISKSMASQYGWALSTIKGDIGNDEASNNSSGFTALPGGYRYYDGTFKYLGSYCFWWNSTEISTDNAWYRCLCSYWTIMYRDFYIKTFGFSVRCIKD